MWFLTSDNDRRVIYFTSSQKEVVVGRSADTTVCDFAITDDSSISRRHAVLTLSANGLVIQDLGSKYSTTVNISGEGVRTLTADDKITLKNGDIIHFGKLNSVWTVHETAFVTCSSTLKGENLQLLKINLEKLNGTWKNDWDNTCTYLTMPAITLTIKVVLALIKGSYIVTTDYWKKCCDSLLSGSELPDPKLFTPRVIESTLNSENISFLPNIKRANIFVGKKIVFFSRKQYEMYRVVVTSALGAPMLLSESKLTKSMLCADDIIVVQYSANNITQETNTMNQVNDIVNYLKSKGKRVVPDAEIGLAVLYASLEKHCNPNFKVSSEVIKSNPEVTKPSKVLAKETQDMESNSKKDEVIIDESLMSNNEDAGDNDEPMPENINKRKLSEDNEIEISAKRRTLEKSNANADGDELFEFINDDSTKTVEQKKLNFTKPQKRKAEYATDDDEELFNFISEKSQSKEKETVSVKREISDDDSNDIMNSKAKKPRLQEANEILPVRGAKALELKDIDGNAWKYCIKTEIKEESDFDTNEIKEKIENLDLGTSVIEIKDDLIKVERDPHIETKVDNTKQNYKKFKKVWPINMKVSMSNNTLNVCRIGA